MMFFHHWKQYQYANTRQYLRLPVFWPVKCKPKVEGSNSLIAQTKDVSAGGIRMTSLRDLSRSGGVSLVLPQNFPIGTSVDLEIFVPPLNRTIFALGQVVRSIPSKEGNYDLGIRFLKIDPKDQADLNEMVEKLSPPSQRKRFRLNWWRKIQ